MTNNDQKIKCEMNFILSSLILLLILLSINTYAKDDFNVISQCSDEYEMDCSVYRFSESKNKEIIKGIKSPYVKKINDNLFYVKSSCGSPCKINLFISRDKDDYTGEYISFNEKNYCLIESDSKKKIVYARNIFSKNKIVILNLNKKPYNVAPSKFNYYSDFNEMSYFDENNNFYLIANDYGKVLFKVKVNSPCMDK